MPHPDHTAETRFDTWLDAYIAGLVGSEPPEGGAPEESDRQSAARRFHGLVADARGQTTSLGTLAGLDAIWEDVMHRTTTAHPRNQRVVANTPSSSPSGQPLSPPRTVRRGGPRWQVALNSLLAAGLILAVMAGFWRLSGGFNGEGRAPFQFAADTDSEPDEGSLRPTQTTSAFSDDPPINMPDALNCTVRPLSVDEVLTIVDDPDSARELPRFLEEAFNAPVPKEGRRADVPPSQETLDAIADAHRLRIACAMAGSWFQFWALSAPTNIYQDVRTRLYPTYVTREEARALLEELESNGKAGGLPPLPRYFAGLDYVQLIDPDPTHSNLIHPVYIEVGTISYSADGRRIVGNEVSAGKQDQKPNRLYLAYGWSDEVGRWLVVGPEPGIGGWPPTEPQGDATPDLQPIAESDSPRPTESLTDAAPITMPTAADCKVEPLSVDDVLAIASDPSWRENRSPAFMREAKESPSRGNYGSEGPGYLYVGTPPSPEALERIVATHRERVACAMLGSWFHVWALTDTPLVYADVVDRLLPGIIAQEDARALLEELQANGKAGGLPLLSEIWGDFQYVDLVDPNPESSHVVFDGQVEVGTLRYNADGRLRSDGANPVEPGDPITARADAPLTYVWSENAGRWLVYILPGPWDEHNCAPTLAGCHFT